MVILLWKSRYKMDVFRISDIQNIPLNDLLNTIFCWQRLLYERLLEYKNLMLFLGSSKEPGALSATVAFLKKKQFVELISPE